jgi:putative ABC transport system permease protein
MTLNVLGLSVAFAAFIVIMIQLNFDLGFDKFHRNYDKIFRIELSAPQLSTGYIAIVSRPIAERFFESSPYIENGTIVGAWGRGDTYFHVEKDGIRSFYKESSLSVTPSFTDIFTFDIVEGSKDALNTPDQVMIPLSIARKLFGRSSAVGQQLVSNDKSQTVGAVYRDFPGNTLVENCIYYAIPEKENKDNWGNFNYTAFIRVNDPANAALLFDGFKKSIDPSLISPNFTWENMQLDIRLTPLTEIHFVNDVQYDGAPKAGRQTLMILLAIAVVIIAIAAINFTNFSTALTPMRIKSLNTQRVMGARRSMIQKSIIAEAMSISFLSYLIALLLIYLFNKSSMSQLVDGDLSMTANPLIFAGTALVALLAGFLSGVYPARYMTSFEPALVLKGSFGLSPKGRKLRNTLIGIQFIASFALIIGASFMYLQNRFMQDSPLGYERDALVTVDIGRIYDSREAFTNQVKAYSGVKDVTYGQFLLSSADAYMKWGRSYKGQDINYMVLPVDYTFLDVMGIKVDEGRGFRREDSNTLNGVYVFNEAARKQFGLELDTKIGKDDEQDPTSGFIVGFIPDIKFASFRSAVEPMAFLVWGTQNWGSQSAIAYIKLNKGANLREAMSHINSTLKSYDAEYPFEVRFLDEVIQRMYEKETALSSLITLFSLLAIFISIVGVFGLVVFDSECRRKEIGIRKVLGASVGGIILMFIKAYFRILIVCFVVAAPLAWYAVSRWLENFAYKTPMYWWVYVLAFIVIGIITAATVTFQNWRVANDDPVKAIKTE